MSSPDEGNAASPAPEEAQQSNGEDHKQEAESQAQPEENAYQPAISAIPPRVTLTEESQMEVSASPAFQCLDDVSVPVTTAHCIGVHDPQGD